VSSACVWLTTDAEPRHLAVVTESVGRIWAELARRSRPPLVLLEHCPAPESGEGMETLDLVGSALMGARAGLVSVAYSTVRARTAGRGLADVKKKLLVVVILLGVGLAGGSGFVPGTAHWLIVNPVVAVVCGIVGWLAFVYASPSYCPPPTLPARASG
jgi:hypothetical protein